MQLVTNHSYSLMVVIVNSGGHESGGVRGCRGGAEMLLSGFDHIDYCRACVTRVGCLQNAGFIA